MTISNSLPITQLQLGTSVQTTDVYCAVDTTDLTMSPNGTTKKYSIAQLVTFAQGLQNNSNRQTCKVGCTTALNALYANGISGVGATLTNNGAYSPLSIDGELLGSGDRVLVQYQTNAFENGIYTVSDTGTLTTPWVLTRANDYNGSLSNQINQGDIVGVVLGSLNALTIWFQTSAGPFVVGTTPITFATEINTVPAYVQSITPGTSATNKAIVLDGFGQIDGVSWSAIESAGTFISSIVYTSGQVNAALSYTTAVTPGVSANNKAIVLDNTGAIDGVGFGFITAAASYVSSLTVSNFQVNTGIGYTTSLTPGVSSASQAIVLDLGGNIDGLPFTDIVSAGFYINGLTYTNGQINALLNQTYALTDGIAVTPAVGTCNISFVTRNIGSIALSVGGYAYTVPSAGLVSITAGVGFFYGNTTGGFFNSDGSGNLTLTITGAAGNYFLIVTQQSGFPVTIPFTIN